MKVEINDMGVVLSSPGEKPIKMPYGAMHSFKIWHSGDMDKPQFKIEMVSGETIHGDAEINYEGKSRNMVINWNHVTGKVVVRDTGDSKPSKPGSKPKGVPESISGLRTAPSESRGDSKPKE